METTARLLYEARVRDDDIKIWINGGHLCILSEDDPFFSGSITDANGSFLLHWVVDYGRLSQLTCYDDEYGQVFDLLEEPKIVDWFPSVVRRFPDQVPLIVKQQLGCAEPKE